MKIKPLVTLAPFAPTVLLPRNEGYALNRTQSTGGIAAKVSLELKKKYLLGEGGLGGSIRKSGSASTLDSKFKSFRTNISDCQKLLKPAPEISASMQTFCSKLDERISPVLSPLTKKPFFSEETKAVDLPDVTKDAEIRPRSPACDTSIVVPQIDWSKNKTESDFIDSLSSESDSNKLEKSRSIIFDNIPRVEVHDTTGQVLEMDSLNADAPKSINTDKKTLNQPKFLPDLEKTCILPEEHDALHVKQTNAQSSEGSDPEQVTALTETELSDDFGDAEFEMSQLKNEPKKPSIAQIGEFDEISQLSVKQKAKSRAAVEAFNSVLTPNLENIEFMDTGTETSSGEGLVDSNHGYVEFKNEDELAEDSLSPHVNGIVETANLNFEVPNQTAHTILNSKENKFGSECIELKPADLERMKQNHNAYENEEDSLLIIDTGTTTEENTCSDSTVKNITEKGIDNNNISEGEQQKESTPEEQVSYKEHCQRLMSKVEFGNVKDSIDIRKSRRKSKSESPPKPDLIQEEKEKSSPITLQLTPTVRPPNLLYKKEEIEKERDLNQKLVQEMVMNKMKLQNKSLERKKRNRSTFSPNRSYELNKSATVDLSPQLSTPDSTYATPDVLLPAKMSPLQKSQTTSVMNESNELYSTPIAKDIRPARPLSVFSAYIDKQPQDNSKEVFNLPDIKKAVSSEDFKTPVAPPRQKHEETKRTVEKMKQTARARCRLLSNEELGLSPEDKLQKLREKISKQEKENVEVHVQDSIESLVLNTERRNSLLYSNDTLKKKRNNSFKRSKSGEDALIERKLEMLEQKCFKPTRTKSVSELPKNSSELKLSELKVSKKDEKSFLHKSDPNLLGGSKKKKKGKDSEQRRSFSKLLTTFFTKKKDNSGGSKGFLSRISPKSKDKSKVVTFSFD